LEHLAVDYLIRKTFVITEKKHDFEAQFLRLFTQKSIESKTYVATDFENQHLIQPW